MICACVLTIFEFNLRSSSWSTLIFAPWLILMHNYMYMAFIPNPFNILLASPMEQTFLYNLMSLFLHRNCHSLSSLNAYIDVDGFHPPIHPIFFMHCKWNFPSNVYLSANISPLGLSFNYQNHTWGLHVLSISPILVIDDNLNKRVYIMNLKQVCNLSENKLNTWGGFDSLKYQKDSWCYQNRLY